MGQAITKGSNSGTSSLRLTRTSVGDHLCGHSRAMRRSWLPCENVLPRPEFFKSLASFKLLGPKVCVGAE